VEILGDRLSVRRTTKRLKTKLQAHSYVQAPRGGSCLLVLRRLNFFETQINVMRNCVKRKKIWHKESYKLAVAVDVRLRSTVYVVTLNSFMNKAKKLLSMNRQNWCHQMSDFTTKMHQIRFRLGFCPRSSWGAYSGPPDPLAGFKGPASR